MNDLGAPEGARTTEYLRFDELRRERAQRPHPRPDRFALWAFGLAVVAMLAAVTTAQAGDGGISDGTARTSCKDVRFGARALAQGDCGNDVRTLNWILRSKQFADGVALIRDYDGSTTTTVKEFERLTNHRVNGRVERKTRRKLVRSMSLQRATWYGPGFWGNTTACGQTLRKRTVGVAHRKLPCGTKVVVGYKGRFVRTRVIDRGPYANHANWDLTRRTKRKLNFDGIDDVRIARVKRR